MSNGIRALVAGIPAFGKGFEGTGSFSVAHLPSTDTV